MTQGNAVGRRAGRPIRPGSCTILPTSARVGNVLEEMRRLIAAHARADLRTSVDGLLVSSVDSSPPEFSLTEPLLVVMAQGAKRLVLGERVYEYRAGHVLVVATALPVSGHFIGAAPKRPALGLGLALRPEAIAPLLLRLPPD